MPQVVLVLAIGAGFYMGYKALKTVLTPIVSTSDAKPTEFAAAGQQAEAGPRNLGALEWDERDQVYRPKA